MTTAVQTKAHLKAIVPQFLMVDLDAAVVFYTEKLGFTVEFTYGDFYVSVQRDGIPIHLKLSDDPEPNRAYRKQEEHLDAYIATDNVDALYSEYQGQSIQFLQDLETKPWGTREFVVEDPGGYILCFSQIV